jgi:hypothetical protein
LVRKFNKKNVFFRKEGFFMPIRFTVDGTEYEVDTVAEAVSLKQAFGEDSKRNARSPASKPRTAVVAGESLANGSPDFKTFVNSLNDNGRAVIETMVKEYPSPLNTDELAKASRIATMSLPPVFKHIKSAAGKAHLNANEIVKRKQVVHEGKVHSQYEISAQIAEILKDLLS